MPVTRALLRPLSWIWAFATARRLRLGAVSDPGAPVICVGNLTMGGSGKTPIVRALTRFLLAEGCAAHIVSRGHGGRLTGPVKVDCEAHTAGQVGDEPLMMARDAPVWVARDRAAAAAAAAAAGAQVIVMDDGFQNPAVRKSLSLIVVDGETRGEEWPFGDGGVFPSGPMREPLSAGLARADAVVVLLAADLPRPSEALLELFKGQVVLLAHLVPAGPRPQGRYLAFAGIGKPWKMERALAAAAVDVVDFAPLPDHAQPTPATLRFLAARAQALGAKLLTSEKDWVRLTAEWRARVAVWPVEAVFDDPAALRALLAGVAGAPPGERPENSSKHTFRPQFIPKSSTEK
jgi:tetraacyldisaccharide 4'-kinase